MGLRCSTKRVSGESGRMRIKNAISANLGRFAPSTNRIFLTPLKMPDGTFRVPPVAGSRIISPLRITFSRPLLSHGGARKAPSSICRRVCDNDPRSGEWSTAPPCDSNATRPFGRKGERRNANAIRGGSEATEIRADRVFYSHPARLPTHPPTIFRKHTRSGEIN